MKISPKKIIKILIPILLIIILFISLVFYTKPPIVVTEMKPQRELSEKIKPVFSDTSDSVLVLIPYKVTVSNNRLRRISLPEVFYKTNHMEYLGFSSSTGYSLYFDEKGKQLNRNLITTESDEEYDNEMFLLKKWKEWKKNNQNIIFPFSSKSIYFYKSTMLKYRTDRNTFVDLNDNFRDQQTQSLYKKPIIEFPKSKIDSLYESDKTKNIILRMKTDKTQGWYDIRFKMKDGTQKFYDIYDSIRKMNREELFRLMSSKPTDDL
jgi:hypothetical protein